MNDRKIGFTCSYTPLPLIDAAGFVPFRVLPIGEAPDQAGSLLHDNLCPQVKRILDRVLAADLPELEGVVIMSSCDAMRRLADAWRMARPADPVELIDLPVCDDEISLQRFAAELRRLAGVLAEWGGRQIDDHTLAVSCRRYAKLGAALDRLGERVATGSLPGGIRTLQELVNVAVSRPLEESLAEVERHLDADQPGVEANGVPVMLFGNVLPDPAAMELFASCGARLVGEDLCTGSKQVVGVGIGDGDEVYSGLARAVLARPPCARSLRAQQPAWLGAGLVDQAKALGARGVIVHVVKFCDPYLTRLPAVRDKLRDAGLPALVLEGDCTLRSLGQHRTRIEAFVEMLGGGAS
jgi:benzoyl-CoA reductase/2-hydroxyglutaryl-CoA dehydratase subunit BcrC/BadD/HgdB